jgi:hypothetical protein
MSVSHAKLADENAVGNQKGKLPDQEFFSRERGKKVMA